MDKSDFYYRQAEAHLRSNAPRRRPSGVAGAATGCLGMLSFIVIYYGTYFLIVAALAALLGLWTDRNLDFFLTYYKETPTDAPFLISWLASIPLPITLIANIICEVVRLFL